MGLQHVVVDQDVQSVLEFMQANVPASKLVSVSDGLPQMARLLWKGFPQESCVELRLIDSPITNGLPQVASESGLAPQCADGDSAAVAGIH